MDSLGAFHFQNRDLSGLGSELEHIKGLKYYYKTDIMAFTDGIAGYTIDLSAVFSEVQTVIVNGDATLETFCASVIDASLSKYTIRVKCVSGNITQNERLRIWYMGY